eukprot:TRINITY_DN6474_c2_g2_i1.p1 TRINITY_DN6474_c2_g2~~TRINITY_DN6474_c2_g2_i1.p1  ORF type:complete len:244 (+),score=60.64 TRINITY_DN6474_c2_g2_i1:162-893(+)
MGIRNKQRGKDKKVKTEDKASTSKDEKEVANEVKKKAPKDKKDNEAVKEVSPEEKAKLEAEAIEEIRRGAAKVGAQKKGSPFVPNKWAERFKPALGNYKLFLKQHSDKFIMVTDESGDFVVRLPGQVEAPFIPDKKIWQKDLTKAWMAYCLVTRKPERDFQFFLASLPKGARSLPTGPSSPAKAPLGSPARGPLASPMMSPLRSPASPSLRAAASPLLSPSAPPSVQKTIGKNKKKKKKANAS